MADNAAFLVAIDANPEDDAPRLIYADWLEEQNLSGQAEYLRLVSRLGVIPDDDPGRERLVSRLLNVAAKLDEAWRNRAGRRFDLIMEGWLGSAMFVFMKAVRWLTGGANLGVMEPNDQSRSVVLRRGVRREEAEAYASEVDPERFLKDRTVKSLYRIVPATSFGALSATTDAEQPPPI